ncbi:hypothetical protein EDB81DRAFT_760644 [Dactylonectria macrodidyma]|uniref:FAD-binding domain-containing protein n=1 Tax=Dactylonectria macrodidyma TaxID=307937 RepID=A0A9P9ELP3_9HYPO|nr:hypothetical protein EDB81DRAFT_760644 [Dactylonectria macrodidyma]
MEETDIVICGCGPTGAMLSTLLGRYGIANVVLEREPCITRDPRGIALDEDGIRHLQACGIYDKIFTDIGECMGKFKFVGGVHNDLSTRPFTVMDYNTTEGGTGHPGFMCHKQPTLEKHLRAQLNSYPTSDLRLNSTVISIREDSNWVYATYLDASGIEKQIRGKFLVAADGKTGFTRKRYLEPLGIRMEQVSTNSYQETWVALNWKISLPTPESHPDFPLWSKGYTPHQVYDSFFPTDFRFLCNSKRPAVCGRFGLCEDRLWRFEFVVHPWEVGQVMSTPDKIRQVVCPYITHAGTRYGLPSSTQIQYPQDCIEVLRSRPYQFAAKSCNKWARGRVILCGDAAHVFPPFGGQGITSGFRDAMSLAWRLVIATRQDSGTSDSVGYRSLLDGWFAERKQQLDKSLGSTIENGTYLTTSGPFKNFVRDWYLWAVQLVPSWRRWLEQGNRRDGMVKYQWVDSKGMVFLPDMAGGTNFPQVYCMKLDGKEKVQFTDDVIFSEDKKALFQVVVLLDTTQDVEAVRAAISGVDEASCGVIQAAEATFIIHSTDPHLRGGSWGKDTVFRLATGQEFAADERLCAGRPEPQYYDPERMMKESANNSFIILRPDRFTFAACETPKELLHAAQCLSFLAADK